VLYILIYLCYIFSSICVIYSLLSVLYIPIYLCYIFSSICVIYSHLSVLYIPIYLCYIFSSICAINLSNDVINEIDLFVLYILLLLLYILLLLLLYSQVTVLSISRIFHKIALTIPEDKRNTSTITVTRYTPRHQYPQQKHHCRYRFQVPDALTYGVSWTDFTYEKMENYNWNYVDQYLCTRGEDDFDLTVDNKCFILCCGFGDILNSQYIHKILTKLLAQFLGNILPPLWAISLPP